MPNHIHTLIFLRIKRDASANGSRRLSFLPERMRSSKTISAISVNCVLGRTGVRVWQERYYDHIVCNEEDSKRIRQYIRENPLRWANDKQKPY